MKRIENPHVGTDHGSSGLCGPAGSCPGHVHVCCPVDGVTYGCPVCGTVTTHAWRDVEDAALACLGHFPDIDVVALPPCPDCGGLPFLNHSNVEYGLELPHHYTLAAVKMMTARPRLRGKIAVNVIPDGERFCGADFSHLPADQRPSHHVGPAE